MTADQRQSHRPLQRQPGRRPATLVTLADAANEVLQSRVLPQKGGLGIIQLWTQLLPNELHHHCEIVEISNGRIKVVVDSAAHMYELKLCSAELLMELQRQCPQAHIKKLKLVLGLLSGD